ncbi:MAG: isoleucine--tRNA ligase, partial [Alphaproteobacteria bacterium]
EWKVEEAFRAEGKNKRDVPMAEFRKACRDYAQKWIDIQRSEFKRLGGAGNWKDPYLTMAYSSEAATVNEFLKVAMSGQLKRGAKPVMWSPVEQTALAEAEIEYADRKANMIWVKFPVDVTDMGGEVVAGSKRVPNHVLGSSVVIWTTTPWTIPANRAVSFNPEISYSVYECENLEQGLAFDPWIKPGDRLIVADKLAESVMKAAKAASWRQLERVSAEDLDGIVLKHPLANFGYTYKVPMLAGSHVTDDAGTGFVHTAPSHGEDDYEVWMANAKRLEGDGIDTTIPNTVDEFGRYTSACPGFEGLEIITVDGKKRGQDGPANKAVMDKLIEAGALLARGMTTLRDAHSWRSKAPVIRRATSQWFIAMDRPLEHLKGKEGKTLRELCLQAIDDTVFTPERGRQRIRAMVEERPDWLISRQRAWGVPLTLFVERETGAILNTDAMNARITKAVREGGADAWFGGDAATFFGEGYDATKVEKINDILDVWFDSGTTHAFTLEDRGLQWPADIYLEGSDQHRGWFQSSLLESCATRGRAPYNGIVTHGFVQAEDGEKMSKSLGNVISPMEVCEKFGADILRIWVASSDYADDPSFGWNLFTANSDSYRKLRNTMRYLLGALDGFDEKERVAYKDMPGLERWVLHRLAELDELVTKAYHAYDFKKAFHELMNFCVVDLSAVYFDIRKDSLYCDAPSSLRRRAARTVMDEVFNRLTIWFAPVMVYTCEEAWEQRHPAKGSVHLQQFPKTPAEWLDQKVSDDWKLLFEIRRVVNVALEAKRSAKEIGSSLEAMPKINLTDMRFLSALDDQSQNRGLDISAYTFEHHANLADFLAEVLIVSAVDLEIGGDEADKSGVHWAATRGVYVYEIGVAPGVKCARSWKYFDPSTADPAFPDITPRDAAAVLEYRRS